MEQIARSIVANRRNPTKAELTDFVRACLEQFAEISAKYTEYFEGDAENPALLGDIEARVREIAVEYNKVFPNGAASPSIASSLVTHYEEIKHYHEELLAGSAGEDSIKADIADSQEKITAFYNELFGTEESQNKAKQIRDFYTALTAVGGIQSETERIADEIITKHKELFTPNTKSKKSLIDELEDGISKADKYKDYIDTELQPLIDETQASIIKVDSDIKVKQNEVSALLSNATAKTLAQGFLESKSEYSNGIMRRYKKMRSKKDMYTCIQNVGIFLYNVAGRHFPNIVNYALFIAPLVVVVLIFTNKDFAQDVLSRLSTEPQNNISRIEALYAKTIISLPMIWIAWYGQRNISQRKRLREEYNHKYRVLQVYLHFLDGENTYKLSDDNRKILESILLASIYDNPARHLGKSETYVDSIRDRIIDTLPFMDRSKKDES